MRGGATRVMGVGAAGGTWRITQEQREGMWETDYGSEGGGQVVAPRVVSSRPAEEADSALLERMKVPLGIVLNRFRRLCMCVRACTCACAYLYGVQRRVALTHFAVIAGSAAKPN